LWRINTKKQSSRLIEENQTGSLKKKENKGKAMAAEIDAKDTMRKATKVEIQTREISPITTFKPWILKASPNSTPKEVAIPLPPLNCKNGVQLWPQIEHKPNRILRFCSSKNFVLVKKKPAKNTTLIKPFNISRIKTAIPSFLPRTRIALVAPTLPEPTLRISIPLSNLQKR